MKRGPLYLILFILVCSVSCNKVSFNISKSFIESSPSFSISNASSVEGQNFVFTVKLNTTLTTASSVEYTTTNGTALSGTHYSPSSGTLTFLPGETTKTISVSTSANPVELCSPDKTFSIQLQNPIGAEVQTSTAMGTITDPDVPSISIADASATEGNSVDFMATLSGACLSKDVTFNWTLTNGTINTATISRGDLNKILSVPTVNDTIYKGTQVFTATLGSVTNATVSDGVGTGTIFDNDSIPVANFAIASQTVSEGVGSVSVSVSLSHASASAITIPVTLSGNATGGTDYTNPTLPLSIAAGSTSGTITFSINDDLVTEASESIILTMDTPVNATMGATNVHTITVSNNDYAKILNVTSSTTDGSLSSGVVDIQIVFSTAVNVTGTPLLNLNTTPARFGSYASGTGTNTLSFNYTIQSGDATADLDYLSISALALAGGTITDSLSSTNADLNLPLPGAAGSLAANKNIAITAPTGPAISAVTIPANGDYFVGNALNFTFTFSENVTVTGTPTVALNIGGSAVTAAYVSGSGTANLVFRYTVQSTVKGTSPVLTSPINLSGGSIKNASSVDSSLTFTYPSTTGILIDGRSLTLNFLTPNPVFLENGGTGKQLTISLSAAPVVNVTIPLRVMGTAQKTSDFEIFNLSVVIPAGQTTATIDYDILDDSFDESTKYFNVIADRPVTRSNILLGLNHGARVSILDDDPLKERWKLLDAREHHMCGITSNDVLKCWGGNTSGELGDGTRINRKTPIVINSGVAYKSVSVGSGHTCAITTTNVLKCWGANAAKQLGDGTTSARLIPKIIDSGVSYQSVSSADEGSCGITTDGVLKCWGNDYFNSALPAVVDSGVIYKSIATSNGHACGIISDDTIKCWGSNWGGQLGIGNTTNQSTPVPINSALKYKFLMVKGAYTCAITMANGLQCWGSNGTRTLGDGTTTDRLSPVTIDSGTTYQSVSTTHYHTCGITTTNVLKCWGENAEGKLGDGTRTNRATPVIINPGIGYKSAAVGIYHTCGITTDDIMKCWGENKYGQLGDYSVSSYQPLMIDPGVNYKSVSGGKHNMGYSLHTCAITTGDELKCWGENWYGGLGDGTKIERSVPVLVDPGVRYKVVSTGGMHSCGVTTTNQLKCWGENTNGRLGDGTTTEKSSPVVIDSATSYSTVALGDDNSCGITTGGVLKCWGLNENGQLGDGTISNRTTPKIIDPGVSYKVVTSNKYHSCGITSADVLKCWGYNMGQIGDGTFDDQLTPKIIDPGISYKVISAGEIHTCGITTDNVTKCWGENTEGQLGDGTTTKRNSPVVIDSTTIYVQILTGLKTTCGITDSGLMRCWGRNNDGQVGDGTTTNRLLPVSIDSSVSYKSLSVGESHTCGITNDNILKCWGNDTLGTLGNTYRPLYPFPTGSY